MPQLETSKHIKRKIRYSFSFIILLFTLIIAIDSIVFYQVKKNLQLRASISNLIYLQEKMGVKLSKVLSSNDAKLLKKANETFINIEQEFEKLNTDILKD